MCSMVLRCELRQPHQLPDRQAVPEQVVRRRSLLAPVAWGDPRSFAFTSCVAVAPAPGRLCPRSGHRRLGEQRAMFHVKHHARRSQDPPSYDLFLRLLEGVVGGYEPTLLTSCGTMSVDHKVRTEGRGRTFNQAACSGEELRHRVAGACAGPLESEDSEWCVLKTSEPGAIRQRSVRSR